MPELVVSRAYTVCGILFCVVLFLGYGLTEFGDLPGSADTDASVVAYYADSGNRTSVIIGAYMIAIAGVLLLVWALRLHHKMSELDANSMMARMTLVGVVIYVALLFGAGAMRVSIAGAMSIDGQAQPGADVSRVLPQVGWWLIRMYGPFASMLMIGGASLFSIRRPLLPGWLAWVGLPLAAVQPLTDTLFPSGVTMLWVLVVSIVLLTRSRGNSTA